MRGLRLNGPIPSPSWSVELSPQHRTTVSVRTPPVLRRLALTDFTTGRAETGLASITVDGEDLDLADDGTFTLEYDNAPTGPVLIQA